MPIIDIPLEMLQEAVWNVNQIDEATLERLRRSIERYGLVQNLVVRPILKDQYEVLSGNQRLKILRELKLSPVACCVIQLEDAPAKLLAQALNRLHGQDDLGLKAEMVRTLLQSLPEAEILAILPNSKIELQGLANLGKETLASYLQNWNMARASRLHTLQVRLTQDQLLVVQRALQRFLPGASRLSGDNPNTRGKALYLLCKQVLEEAKLE